MRNDVLPERLERKTVYESTETDIMDINEVAEKKRVSIDEAKHMLKHNETRDGISMLAILYAFEFYR